MFISFNIFATDIYNKIFYKPGLHMELYTDSMFLNFEYVFLSKYSYMNSSDLLKYVWAQDRTLIGGQMYVESNYYTHAISSSNAIGLLQLKPIVANDLGIDNLFDPIDNVTGATIYHSYLNKILQSEKSQIAAYYQGPNSVLKNGINSDGLNYYNKVKKAQKNYKNTQIYSPMLFGIKGNVSQNYLNLNTFTGLAYKTFEFYSTQNIELIKSNITKFNFNFGLLYFPKSNFALGTSTDNSFFLRTGYPWNQNIVSINNLKTLDSFYLNLENKNGLWLKLYINEFFNIITGFSVYDIKFGVLFNSNFRIGVYMSL
ncbi:lytic transglycosylase domain-containing protein [Marinitoga sp. 38H-ov]|uniref:lytic transglycosylase domain-containing protein n=1 Tax=Marinitoga sp. 38H-ov TaxID=1755814 RepID=UPI0019CFC0A2|nr:lytic transglycosylase domain-containing protein [Marinitoga sp. 38H-ov]